MSDKRIRPRMHRRIPVAAEVRYEGATSGEGQLADLSEGGLSFIGVEQLAAGEHFEFEILDEDGDLKLPGSILYAEARDGEWVHGVRFDDEAAASLDRIRALLRKYRFKFFRRPV